MRRLAGVAAYFEQAGITVLENQQSFMIIFVACFLSAAVLFFLFVFLPNVDRSNMEIKRKRFILLLVPGVWIR
jgi:uncharacterized membrane protein YjjP (DUF1212 family)